MAHRIGFHSPDLAKSGTAQSALAARQGRVCAPAESPVSGALTIDIEDYFQVEAFANVIDRSDWDRQEPRVATNTHRLLDILAEARVTATFFTLGWVASRNPQLIRRIIAEGHELASHGSDHYRVDHQTERQFRSDVRRSKHVLEDIAGSPVIGYRAPTFSIGRRTPWVYRILAEEGFQYSSSIYPVTHDLYGDPQAPRTPFFPETGLLEIPLTTVRVMGRNFQAAGGGYFRLLPYTITRMALRKAREDLQRPCVFYLHPWEIDPGQPRQSRASRLSKFRHYFNIHRTEPRLRHLLQDFKWDRMDRLFLGEQLISPPEIKLWAQ